MKILLFVMVSVVAISLVRCSILRFEGMSAADRAKLTFSVVSWMEQEEARYLPDASSLSAKDRELFNPYFPQTFLKQVRVISVGEFRRPRIAGPLRPVNAVRHQVQSAKGLALGDTIAMLRFDPSLEPSRRAILFRELVRALQYREFGVDHVVEHRFRSWDSTGKLYSSPYDVQAMELQARFARDPSDFFSVALEVERLRKKIESDS